MPASICSGSSTATRATALRSSWAAARPRPTAPAPSCSACPGSTSAAPPSTPPWPPCRDRACRCRPCSRPSARGGGASMSWPGRARPSSGRRPASLCTRRGCPASSRRWWSSVRPVSLAVPAWPLTAGRAGLLEGHLRPHAGRGAGHCSADRGPLPRTGTVRALGIPTLRRPADLSQHPLRPVRPPRLLQTGGTRFAPGASAAPAPAAIKSVKCMSPATRRSWQV